MKYLLVVVCFVALFSCDEKPTSVQSSSSQNVIPDSTFPRKQAANPYVPVDVSPMDMAYFPTDFPVKKMSGEVAGLPVMRVTYSRPHRGGRQLFGKLVQWGQPWRLGANEATEIQFFQSVTIQKQKVEKGTYILYCIPYQDKWTLVLNKNLFSWGLKFNQADDVAKFDVPVINKEQQVEHFTIAFEKSAAGAELIMAWEATEARMLIEF
jgi:hypothetical protein